jgi:hypothetical protein
MTPEEIEAIWKDRQNCKWGFYYCRADPRVIVPRRRIWGWTINFARPSAIPALLGMMVLIVLPASIVRLSGGGTAITYLTGAASILIVCLLSANLSSTKRWNH